MGLLTLANCATTHETLQECRKAAYAFCDKTAGTKDAGAGGATPMDAAEQHRTYQACLDTQVAACGTGP